MHNLTSRDKDGKILVNIIFKVCNTPSNCDGSSCSESCIINVIIERLYELEKSVVARIATTNPHGRTENSIQYIPTNY